MCSLSTEFGRKDGFPESDKEDLHQIFRFIKR